MKPSAGWPLTKAITAGIDWMPIWPGTAGCSSMFILTSLTLPLAAFTAFSRIGVSCLHGPHQGAQKSISTGWRFDSSITSFTKVWVVVSLISPSAAGARAGRDCHVHIGRVLKHVVLPVLLPLSGPRPRDARIVGLCPIRWCPWNRLQSGLGETRVRR